MPHPFWSRGTETLSGVAPLKGGGGWLRGGREPEEAGSAPHVPTGRARRPTGSGSGLSAAVAAEYRDQVEFLLETCLEWSRTLKPQTACCSALGGTRQYRLRRERGSGACVGVCWVARTARSTLFFPACRDGLQGQEARGAAHPPGAPHGRADPGGRAGGARRGPGLHRTGSGRRLGPLWEGRGRRGPARATLPPEPDLCGHEPAAAAGGCPVGAEACRPAAGGRGAGAGHQPGGPSGSAWHSSRLLGVTRPTRTSGPPLSIWPGTPHLTPGPWVPEDFWLSVLRPRYALAPRDPRGHSLPSRCGASLDIDPLPEDGIQVCAQASCPEEPRLDFLQGPGSRTVNPSSLAFLWRPCFTDQSD